MKIKKATVADSAEKGWRCLSEDETKELYGAGSIPHMAAMRFGAVMMKESEPFLSPAKVITGTCGSCKTIGKIHSDTKLCLTCDKR